jgi:hypothetical protein
MRDRGLAVTGAGWHGVSFVLLKKSPHDGGQFTLKIMGIMYNVPELIQSRSRLADYAQD